MAAKPKPLRAAIYTRVSQDRSRRERSVDEQEAESRQACARHGWAAAEVYCDNSISASRFSTRTRPDWQRLVADLEAGRYDVLVLWEPSRGSRDLVTWAALLDACRRRGMLVHVTSHDHTYDLSNPRDWRALAEDGIDSEYEMEKHSKRVTRAMHANAVAGRPHGRVPYGYTRRYDPATKELVGQEVDPVTAPVVREIFERVGRAEPVSAITKDLNDRGIPSPTGGRWHRQNVRRTALSRIYVAEREYAGEVTAGNWPELVSREAFYAAQRVLLNPARTTTHPIRPGRYRYLLSYYATCGVCGKQLQAAPRRGTTAYFCTSSHVHALVPWLDEVVVRVALARLADPALMARLAATDDGAVVAAREQIAALRGRLAEWRDAAAAGEVTPASLAHVESRLLADIAAAERAATAAVPAVVHELAGAEGLAARWEGLPMATRREVLAALGMTVALDRSAHRGRHARGDYGRVRIGWEPA